MKDRIEARFNSLKEELFGLALEIHAHPELGLKEHRACALQRALLEKYGFAVELPYCGLDTAFKAIYHAKKPGPKIACLSEYDAIEGLGHACGHNLMAMNACGSAIVLRDFADAFGGSVFVFGTPAEETAGGKCIMAEKGAFDGLDAALIAHPGPEHASSGTSMALHGYRFEFFGKPAHSAANPDKGINALDAAINTFNMIAALRQHIRRDSFVHGIIEHGGDAANIVPKYASVLMEVRAPDMAYHKELCEKTLNCARAAALGTGCRLEISHYEEFFDMLVTNQTLSDLYDGQLRALGVTQIEAPDHAGVTDVGNVSRRCPTIQPIFHIDGVDGTPWQRHTSGAAEATGTLCACENALIAAKALALAGARLFSDPALVEEVRREFSCI